MAYERIGDPVLLPRTGAKYILRRVNPRDVGDVRRQRGILAPESNPATDADVIMTAAVVGYAYFRGKGRCRFDFEPDVSGEKYKQDLQDHESAVAKLNRALGPKFVTLGKTPTHSSRAHPPETGELRITGGTGNLTGPARYHPADPRGLALRLYQAATGKLDTPVQKLSENLGYQGRGAYTGFIDGRKGGQTALMPTYRLRAAQFTVHNPLGSRWMPTKVDKRTMGAAIGTRARERIWGMIADNRLQVDLAREGMYFQDSDRQRGASGLTTNDIVGYVHGMIQAIYDVAWRGGGTPYEIAVGAKTTKLASCFPCTLFMEANGFPASSTHLGRGESWCIVHPHGSGTSQDRAFVKCNDKWARYCCERLRKGVESIREHVRDDGDYKESFASLENFFKKLGKDHLPSAYAAANLILDAVTVHDSECSRIIRTLKPLELLPSAKKREQPSSVDPNAIITSCPLGSLEITVEGVDVDVGVLVAASPDGGSRRWEGGTLRTNATWTETAPPERWMKVRRVKLGGLHPGSYKVEIRYNEDLARRFFPTPAQEVTVKANEQAKVTFVMERCDYVELTFVDDKGKPLAKEPFEISLPGEAMQPANALDSGKRRFEGIRSGACELRVKIPGEWTSAAEF